ncbi:DNA-directed RNA polymerase III subunit RPC4 [Kappamyces sp. JEL0829]|nr:DNA-directed RNA polymerase III subunit RPC4 [Kappamyces sp. JEL0829]
MPDKSERPAIVAPKVPSRRTKRENVFEKEKTKVKTEKRPKEKFKQELTASGPFAMGPAERTGRSSFRTAAPTITSIRDIDHSDDNVELSSASSEDEADSLEDFIVDDETPSAQQAAKKKSERTWAPVSIIKPKAKAKAAESQTQATVKIKPDPGAMDVDVASTASATDEASIMSMTPPSSTEMQEDGVEEPVAGAATPDPVHISQQIAAGAKDGHFLFFQFPATLPVRVQDIPVAPESQPVSANTSVNTKSSQLEGEKPSTLQPLSSGRVGSLVIRKSGRMSIVMGNVEFDVSAGPSSSIPQQLCIMDPSAASRADPALPQEDDKAQLVMLGDCKDRFICTPNIDSLLR